MVKRRGIALMIALLVSIFIFVLALSLIALDSEQNQFNVQQEHSMRAYFAARSGLEFYRMQSENFTIGQPVPGIVPAPATSACVEQFQVTLQNDGDIVSVGTLVDRKGKTLATATLVVPGGDMTQINETQ